MRRHPFDTRSPFGLDSPFGGPRRGGGAATEFATLFDGSSDGATWSSLPTGLSASGPSFSASMWFSCLSSATHLLFSTPFFSTEIAILVDGSGKLLLRVNDTAGGILLIRSAAGAALDDGARHHLAFTVDRASGRRRIDVDGVSVVNDTGYPTANDIKIHGATSHIGKVAASVFHGKLWEFWADDTAIADLSDFRTVGGEPADLGADGSGVGGSQPVWYLPDGNPADNKGTGGAGTIVGAPTQVARPTS